jgi:hypothetical protein
MFCFAHNIVTPQAAAWLAQIPSKIHVLALAGGARVGKSTTANAIALAIDSFVNNAPASAKSTLNLSASMDRFAAGDSTTPVTHGIQGMALPRFCDETGTQQSSMDGSFLICDVEGVNLGDTRHHTALLGLVTRFTTHLSFFSGGQFDFSILDNLDTLVSSNIVINGMSSYTKGSTAPPSATNTSGSATGAAAIPPVSFNFSNTHWPKLALAVNLYRLQPPTPDHKTWIANELRHQPEDPHRNQTRSTIRNIWLDKGKLTFHTLPIDLTLTLDPAIVAMMPEAAQEAIKAPYKASLKVLIDEILTCPELTVNDILGNPSPNSTSVLNSRHVDGAFLSTFLSELIAAYANTGTFPPDSAMVRTIVGTCDKHIKTLTAEYSRRSALAPYNLSTTAGFHDVDGAKGAADDAAAASIKKTLKGRHDALVQILLGEFEVPLKPYDGLGFDKIIQKQREALQNALDALWNQIEKHWNHMRDINHSLTTSEASTKDGPSWTRVHHVEKEQVWFHTNTHYFWARYVHRYPISRLIQTRYNGDRVYGKWDDSGAPFEVQIEGPWHGGAP